MNVDGLDGNIYRTPEQLEKLEMNTITKVTALVLGGVIILLLFATSK